MSDYEPVDRVHNHGGLKQFLWPWGPLSFLGLATAVLSGISLWFLISGTDPGSLLSIILEGYDEFLGRLLGWVAPIIERIVFIFDIRIELQPHWKHIFVLMSLYFSAGVWAESKAGHIRFAVVRGSVGLLLALFTSVVLGSFALTKAWLPNFIVAAVPALATGLNDLLLTLYRHFAQHRKIRSSIKAISVRTIVCIGIATAFPLLVGELEYPGLGGLALVIAVHVVNQVRLAFVEIGIWRAGSSEPWHSLFLESKSGLMTLRMVSVVFWVIVLLVLDVGWETTPWA